MQKYMDYSKRVEELAELLAKKDGVNLSKLLRRTNPVDIEEFISTLSSDDALLVFRLLKKEDAIEVFAKLDPSDKDKIKKGLNDAEFTDLLEDLDFDDMIDTLEEMPASVVQKILRNTDPEIRKRVNQYLKFPEDSAASLMTPEFVELKINMTVKEALATIKRIGKDKVTVYTCYVTDTTKKLLGYVSLRNIVTSDENTLISSLLYEDVISVRTDEDQEEVARTFQKYGFTALPVVDKENMLVGIITVDDIMWIIEQEATEDFQIMAATTPEEEEYSKMSVWKLAKNRIPWLMFLMISSAFTSTILRSYEAVIQSIIALNMFIPMLTDSGGNAGSQTSTLVIRAMATHDVELSDWMKVFWKEFRVGVVCGLSLGLVSFLKCMFFDKVGVEISLIVAVTLLLVVITAKVVGSLLPMLASRLGADPAIMASPLITTIVDSVGLIVYFNIAQMFISVAPL
jgi:hypothetical protein